MTRGLSWFLALVASASACKNKQGSRDERQVAQRAPSSDDAAIAIDAAVNSSPIPDNAGQLLLTVSADWDAVPARLFRFERDSQGQWQSIDANGGTAVVLGSAGMGWGRGVHGDGASMRLGDEPIKVEGDRKSPAGVFAIGAAYGYAATSPTALPYTKSTSSLRCVADPASSHYNRILDANTVARDWQSAEKMRRRDELYRWVIEVDHNHIVPHASQDADGPTPGDGSCIFLHVWRGPDSGTLGCTAMPQSDIESLLAWLDPAQSPVIVALPEVALARVRDRWGLPRLPSPE